MPPFSRYWPAYAVMAAAIGLLGYVFFTVDFKTESPRILYAGALIAFLSFTGTIWSQWVAGRTQHTLAALQALRTDHEYLIAALALRRFARLGQPLSDKALAALQAGASSGTGDPLARPGEAPVFNPTFPEAVDFVLNQYEFLAAGVRQGAMDQRLLEATQRGVVLGLGRTFAPYIRESRTLNPRVWENFVCLFHRFARHDPPSAGIDLGELPRRMLYPRHGYPHGRLYPEHQPPWPWNRPGGGW